MKERWIGTWSPGIGDPSIGGWITVLLYAVVAWLCHRVQSLAKQRRIVLSTNERLVWPALMVAMVLLGINKQLDLQSALTELGRILAIEHGWYGHRRQYQEAFIAAVPVVGLTVFAAMVVLVWNAPPSTWWACAGAAGLMVFVAIRAASFHHVDYMLGWRLAGLPMNWVLEMGSLLVIGWGARMRTRVRA